MSLTLIQLQIESPANELYMVPGQASHRAGPLTVLTALDQVGPQWISLHITQRSQVVFIGLDRKRFLAPAIRGRCLCRADDDGERVRLTLVSRHPVSVMLVVVDSVFPSCSYGLFGLAAVRVPLGRIRQWPAAIARSQMDVTTEVPVIAFVLDRERLEAAFTDVPAPNALPLDILFCS